MRLTILGCSGSVPGPATNGSGYVVEFDGFRLAVELGTGTVGTLLDRYGPYALDALVLTHLHPDHCADFGALTVVRRYHPDIASLRPDRLPVYGPPGTEQRLVNLYATNESERRETDLTDVFSFADLSTDAIGIGPFDVQPFKVFHPTPTYGLRIAAGGKVLAYTADTGVCPSLDELAADADVLLSEASWTHAPDRPVGVHLSGVEAGELAQRSAVKRLLVTHIPPWTDAEKVRAEVQSAFQGPVDLVEQGASYDI